MPFAWLDALHSPAATEAGEVFTLTVFTFFGLAADMRRAAVVTDLTPRADIACRDVGEARRGEMRKIAKLRGSTQAHVPSKDRRDAVPRCTWRTANIVLAMRRVTDGVCGFHR